MNIDMSCPRNRLLNWMQGQSKRNEREWEQWDGTEAHGITINDAQCERIDQAKIKVDSPLGLNIPCCIECKCHGLR